MVTDQIPSNSAFLPRHPFSISLDVVEGDSSRTIVKMKSRSRFVSKINGAIVRHVKSDEQVDMGEVVTRSLFSQ